LRIVASSGSIFPQHRNIKRELSPRVSRSAIATKHSFAAIVRCEYHFARRHQLGVHREHHSIASYALAAPLMSPQQSEPSSTA
jgi:hypothetical protein